MKTKATTCSNVLIFAISLFGFCRPAVAQRPAFGDLYERNADDYESLGWVANIARLEGPASDRSGNLYFTEQGANRIMKLSAAGGLSTFRQPSNGANGLIVDDKGRLIACESGERDGPARVTRTNLATGEIEVLVEQFEGKGITGPNDVTIDGSGRIYFTDRRRRNPVAGRTNVAAVYRIDVDGTVHRILAEPDIRSPNGVMISPDDNVLYLVESNLPGFWGAIRAYDLDANGSVSNMRVFHDFGKGRGGDGMAIDTEGNLYVAAGLNRRRGTEETLETPAGIHVFSPDAELKHLIPVPEDTVTNCAFGGVDMKTLYVTAGKSVLSVRTVIAGTRR